MINESVLRLDTWNSDPGPVTVQRAVHGVKLSGPFLRGGHWVHGPGTRTNTPSQVSIYYGLTRSTHGRSQRIEDITLKRKVFEKNFNAELKTTESWMEAYDFSHSKENIHGCICRVLTEGVILLHDNTRQHTAQLTKEKLQKLGGRISFHIPPTGLTLPQQTSLIGILKYGLREKKY
ncbi:hypothetical protein J6590_021429 [Homalodisca vitripennis]|nr:hypothetical protein J6590_021429 [Homalodisca vitripennis]